MVSLKTIKKRLKSGPKSTGCNTITPVNSDQNGIRGTENPACDIWASESFDSVEKVESTTHRQLSLPEVKSTTHNELNIPGNFLRPHIGTFLVDPSESDNFRYVAREPAKRSFSLDGCISKESMPCSLSR